MQLRFVASVMKFNRLGQPARMTNRIRSGRDFVMVLFMTAAR